LTLLLLLVQYLSEERDSLSPLSPKRFVALQHVTEIGRPRPLRPPGEKEIKERERRERE